MSPEVVFTLLYLLLSCCVIYPPSEFVTSGFTITNLLSGFLGSEKTQFIRYHIKRTCLNVLVFSLLPLGYVLSLFVFGFENEITSLFTANTVLWKVFTTSSLVLPILALYQVKKWTDNDYKNHPIVTNLSKFCNNNTDWKSVGKDIETEFRRVEKICIQANPITKIIATENWILKVTPFTIFFTHQSDATLSVKAADSYSMSHVTLSETQFLNIEVKSSRRGVEPFVIRINASDFKDLQDRVARSITVLPNVKFHKSVVDQFVDVFKETVKNNPLYETDQDLDQCIGCLQTRPNIKIQKLCQDSTEEIHHCSVCYCRPMWCVDCMAKWFASRQDVDQRGQWLASKCSCPLCRATFCVLDVCMLAGREQEQAEGDSEE